MANITENTSEGLTTGEIVWTAVDSLIILATLAGNILTIFAIKLSRRISSIVSNQFILNLALSDLMVGLTIPYHLAFSIGNGDIKTKRETCVLRFVLIILACSSSIYNLLAIAADRYIAIVHPLKYTRYMTRKVAVIIKIIGWVLSVSIATVPIYWNIWREDAKCSLEQVLPALYINFIVTPMFVSIWVAMLLVYFRIWREASGHAKRLRSAAFYHNGPTLSDSKSVQVMHLDLTQPKRTSKVSQKRVLLKYLPSIPRIQ